MEPCTQGGRRGRSAARAMERAREQVLPSRPSEPSGPADTVALDFRPPELGENKLPLFKAPVWGTVPWPQTTSERHSEGTSFLIPREPAVPRSGTEVLILVMSLAV